MPQDISLDFHSLKKKQNLVFKRRGSNVSITSQVTSQSHFKEKQKSPKIKQETQEEIEKRERLERVKNLFKLSLLGRVCTLFH